MPLRAGERWVGFLALSWFETQQFTEGDARTYRSLADQAAIIMNNQLLFVQAQKRAAELATVAEVGAVITTIRDVDALLQRVVDLTKEQFGLYHVHIYLRDENGQNMVLTSGAGEIGRQMVAEGRIIPLNQTQSLIARAVRTRKGVIVNDVKADKDFLPHALLPDTKSEMAVPMIVANEVLGVLDIQASQMNHFSDEDVQIQTTLAAQIGVALQNARLFARSEATLKELEAATRKLRREGWESYLQSNPMDGLSYGYDQKEIKPLALAANTRTKKRSKKEETPAVPTLMRSLQVQGESIGSLMLAEPTFAEDDAQDIMTAVAERLSAHIENLRLTEQTQRALSQTEEQAKRLAMLNEISARLGEAVTLEELYDLAVTRCAELIGADRTSLQMIQPEGQTGMVTAVRGEEVDMPAGTMLEMAGSPMEMALRENRVVPTIMGSAIVEGRVAPLYAGGKPLGTLNVGSKRKGFFTERDDNLLLQLATILSSVIDNRRLLGAAEARAGELSVLNEMVGELTTMLDVEPILEAIYRFSSRLMDTTNFYIAMHHALTNEVSFPVAVEEGKRVLWRTRPYGNGMSEYILSHGQSLFVEDGLERWLKSQGVESIGSPSQSWMGVPLRIGNEVIGVIALQSLEPRFYTREQFDLLNAVANQAAIAIQNARQFQQEQARAQRQQMLREIAAKVRGSADVDAIMRTAVQEIGQVLGRQTYVVLGANSNQPVDEDA
ncbi:MAG: GAF domain-containing protein [Anaerolineae bacterium]|nr:GAF domain-containing protein [Anaerolineae bacterium]